MRNPRVFVLAVLAVLAVGVIVGLALREPAPKTMAPPERLASSAFVLKNGLEVDLVSGGCGDKVAAVLLFRVGMEHDPKGRSGMAHLVRHLLSAAAPGKAARVVETGSQHTEVSVTVPGDRLFAELDELAGRMRNFSVGKADFDRAKARVLDDLAKRSGGDASLTAVGIAAESVRASSAKGWLGGIAAEMESVELSEVEAFLKDHLKPKNARLVVVGQFDPKSVRARVVVAFGPLASGTPPTLKDPAGTTVTGTLVMGEAPSALALAVAAPATSDPAFVAFLVLAARLTDGTFPSNVTYDPLGRPETLLVTAPFAPGDRPDPAAKRIRDELAKRLEPRLGPKDIPLAKERFSRFLGVGELDPAVCRRDPHGLALGRARRAQLRLESAALTKALDKVTQAELDIAAQNFAPARTTAVIAGGAIR